MRQIKKSLPTGLQQEAEQVIKTILYGIALLLLVVGLTGYFLYQKKPARADQQSAAYRMTATELLHAFQQNEQAANSRYLGKWLEVDGVVNLANGEDGVFYLGEPVAASSVSCLLDSSYKKQALSIKAGDTISVKGYCSGYLMDVQLTRAQLVPKKQSNE